VEYILFIIGFVILIGGATLLIDGASAIGRKLGISEAITGLTIVAIGTSLPELIINLFASIEGSTDLAISNVLGSNIINILGIVGLTALISPIPVSKHTYIRDIPFSMLAVALLFLLVQDQWFSAGNQNVVGRTDGFIFIALLFVFLYIYYRSSKSALKEEIHAKVRPLWLALTFIMAGITGLYFGGEWIVAGAVRVAGLFGMDESTVGLTIIAAATSLPELVTSIIASVKRKPEIAIGNAVGSCIFNILLVLGLSSVISPLPFSPASLLDLIVALLATVTLVVFVYTGGGRKISRVEGGLMIMLYAGYLWWILT
jgi:cation:H+ antiporter